MDDNIDSDYDVIILIPMFNDFESLYLLLEQIDLLSVIKTLRIALFVVNDGGNDFAIPREYETFQSVYILTLVRNLGHQRAISVGLAYIARNLNCKNVVVMDADGEDLPQDIVRLIDSRNQFPNHIVFASRNKRTEGVLFRFFYVCYKYLFRALTGAEISFGNFCIIPRELLQKLTYLSEIAINFPAGTLKSRLPIATIPSKRGKRLAGTGKMGFIALVIHGLSAYAVYLDSVSVRLLIASSGIGLIASLGMVLVIFIKVFTDIAVTGWATATVLGLAIIALQGVTSASIMVMSHLAQRNQMPLPPILMFRNHVEKLEKAY
jgi:glycosyltransferase involved in cell wall biosynthesis